MSTAAALYLTVLVPALGALAVAVTGSRPNLRESMTLAAAGALFLLVLSLLGPVTAGQTPRAVLAEPLPGLALALSAEPLGLLFALVASFLWIVTSVYAVGYMRGHHEPNQTRFYTCFALALSGGMGVAFADNLLTLFVFYEFLTLSTYPLVTHSGTAEAKRAGRVYLGLLFTTSIGLLLPAMVWTFHLAGTLDFKPGGILAGTAPAWALGLLYLLYVFGTGKAALMPFHRWLPAAMVAPTPVSALLHAVAVVKAGVFTILKVTVYIFGIDVVAAEGLGELLKYVAAFTILVGSLVAMTKDNLKARLAYSTISQLSYIVLGALLANAAGIIGGAMHIAMHAFGKITLFFCAGAILVAAHKTEISEMGGLGRRMPLTMGAFAIGAFSIIGLPPFGGMWTKWYLAMGVLDNGELWLLGVLLVSSLLNIAYLLPIPVRAFFDRPPDGEQYTEVREAPLPSLIAIGITAAGCLGLFFFPGPLYRLAASLPA
ncbi:MAG TPA: monovalent cation/H+ antiporter subunit D family protein [Gammaproteobacteria bacterium]|nr:monovalent cation/H+ antiporter subunit D family protein [Gammaproteobacteria bacterium]